MMKTVSKGPAATPMFNRGADNRGSNGFQSRRSTEATVPYHGLPVGLSCYRRALAAREAGRGHAPHARQRQRQRGALQVNYDSPAAGRGHFRLAGTPPPGATNYHAVRATHPYP